MSGEGSFAGEVDALLKLLQKAEVVNRTLEAEDLYQVLGMTRSTFDESKVKKAYLKAMRDIHPGRRAPPALQSGGRPAPRAQRARQLTRHRRVQTSAPLPEPRRRRSG